MSLLIFKLKYMFIILLVMLAYFLYNFRSGLKIGVQNGENKNVKSKKDLENFKKNTVVAVKVPTPLI